MKWLRVENAELGKLQTAVNRYCRLLTKSGWDAEDLAQDVWIKVFRTEQGLQRPNPEAFVLRTAKNAWIDHWRRKTVQDRLLETEPPKHLQPAEDPFAIEMMLQALMKHLPLLQLTVFLLRDVFGYSNTETAKWLETTEGAVKAALHRARHSLARVRTDLEKDALPYPDEEREQFLLRDMAAAYRAGNIERLIKLAALRSTGPNTALLMAA